MRKKMIAFGLLILLMWAVPVGAGGWAVISLDEIPGPATAGQPLQVSFSVLQHGLGPADWIEPEIRLTAGDGTELVIPALPTGQPGHYSAEVVFPQPGSWEWKVVAQPFLQQLELPSIEVAAPASSQMVPTETSRLAVLANLFRWAALVLLLLAAFNLLWEQRRRPVLA